MKIDFKYTKELLTLNEIYNKNNQDNLRIVGGAVRNFLINKEINDYDLSSIILPEDGIKLLQQHNIKVIPTGIKFGTITAVINGKTFEITTTRKDIKTDGRHANVEFTNNFKVDAERRDFTFNALYLDFKNNVYDYFDGITDLNKGIVRFIGNAEQRIKEDYLRILRFFRFFSYYGVALDNEGLKYSIEYKDGLKSLSGERIKTEMFKTLLADYPLAAINIMKNNGILQIITELNNFNINLLEIFYSIKKYIKYKVTCPLILALFLDDINSLDTIKNKWKLSKKENTETFNILQRKNDNLYSQNDIKELLFYTNNKDLTTKITIYNSIINSNKIKEELSNYINNLIDFIEKTEIPVLPITAKDLKDNNFKDVKQYSQLLQQAKTIFAKSSFKLGKKEIIERIK